MKNSIDKLLKNYNNNFNSNPDLLFVSHGRIEVIGNHVDHNLGKCMSARCDKAIYAFVNKTNDNTIKIFNENNELLAVDLNDLSFKEEEKSSSKALIKGVAKYLKNEGYNLTGFNAVTFSTIPQGSGLSSSAAFETLIANIFNHYANEDKINKILIAKASQYAERDYFGKSCGLLDQISVVFPGIKFIDFEDIKNPKVELYKFPFDLKIVLVNTLGSHAGLDKEYSSIPKLMLSSAKKMGVNFLRETDKNNLNSCKNALNEEEINKTTHFFNEIERVDEALKALIDNDIETFLNKVNESNESSKNLLKNTMLDTIIDSPQEVMDYAETINSDGAKKINGGGFKGTVVIYVRKDKYNDVYKKLLDRFNDRVIEIEIDNDGKDYYSLDEVL